MVALAACEDFDFDLRDMGNGFDTSSAVQTLPGRPRPDDRHVDIEYLALCFAHFEPPVLDRLTEG